MTYYENIDDGLKAYKEYVKASKTEKTKPEKSNSGEADAKKKKAARRARKMAAQNGTQNGTQSGTRNGTQNHPTI